MSITRKNTRGKIEIMADILSLSTVGTKKTHIMYRANLSYEQIVYYLRELQGKGLLEQREEEGNTVYGTTERGREFLGHYSQVAELMREQEKYPKQEEQGMPLLAQ